MDATFTLVGGGFSGTVLAVQLLRRLPAAPARIVLVDPAPEPGRGVAYARLAYPYLLNVPAGQLSIERTRPNDFVDYAKRTLGAATARDFLPRALYGDYLIERLRLAIQRAPAQVSFEHVRAEAVAVEKTRRHSWLVTLSSGERIASEAVVLATGHARPAPLAAARGLDRPNDLWEETGAIAPDKDVLILGTGLTMADAVCRLAQHGDRSGRIMALSRHGLLPQPQSDFCRGCYEGDAETLERLAGVSARALLHHARGLADEAGEDWRDWREVIAYLREHAPAIWHAMPEAERARFLRHVRPYWDVHRHRLPAATAEVLANLFADRRLEARAGRLLSLEPWGDRIRASVLPRGAAAPEHQVFDHVINCTGPDARIAQSRDPLWRTLVAGGLVKPDPLGLGLCTGAGGELLDSAGRVQRNAWYLGPLLRAEHWEATAVPELRVRAEQLAARLVTGFGGETRRSPARVEGATIALHERPSRKIAATAAAR